VRQMASSRASLLFTISILVGGCAYIPSLSSLPLPSHLHDDAKAKAAKDAQDTMTAYAKNAPDVYAAMTANLETVRLQQQKVLQLLARNAEDSLKIV
jgi:hypothetical protein